jgi:hypothetical protein
MLDSCGIQRLIHILLNVVIRINKSGILSGSDLQPGISGCAYPLIFLIEKLYSAILRLVSFDEKPALVRRTVIDEYKLTGVKRLMK